jgi:glycosyltransferase involved in cell wall biosynthesis
MSVIATSDWKYNNAKKSNLLKDKKIYKFPLPIDTNFWKPIEKNEAKKILGWDIDKVYFLFGFSDYGKKHIKGLDTSIEIFNNYKNKVNKNVILNIFGEIDQNKFNDHNIKVLGSINNNTKLRLIYSASDLLLNPSRLESFGQIALEALSCNLPIVTTKNTGTSDLILNENMGFKFDENIDEFNKWFLKIHSKMNQNNLHSEIEKKFSYEVIGESYKKFFENYK